MRLISLFGIIFLFCGLLIKLFPPHKNAFYGYKSPMSLINKDTWQEANRFSSITMIIIGFIFVSISLINELNNNFLIDRIPPILYPILILCSITFLLSTEIHLLKLFDINGYKRKK